MVGIENAGLEQSQGYASPKDDYVFVYRNDGTLVDTVARGEDNPPAGWGIWHVWDDVPWDPNNDVGLARPETRYAPHTERVLEGETGYLMFTFYRVHHGGLVQRVEDLEPGVRYTFTIGNHAWAATKDDPLKSEGAPGPFYALTADIENLPNSPNYYQVRVGIDPTGGLSPFGDNVDWGDWATILNAYRDVPAVAAVAQSERVTLFTEHLFRWPFKHCDAYYDGALMAVSQDQPAHDGWVDGREPYERTYLLLDPNADREWAEAAMRTVWDARRWTVGGSADDAGIGPRDGRRVVAVNPSGWVDDLEAFFDAHYWGLEYVPIEAATVAEMAAALEAMISGDDGDDDDNDDDGGGDTDPGDEEPPAAAGPELENLPRNLAGGLHAMGVFRYWQEMVRRSPPGVLKVFSAGDAWEIGRFARALEPGVERPKTRSVWRKYVSNDGAWVNVADRRASARAFLELYKQETATAAHNFGITEAALLANIDYISDLNEVIGTWDPETPRHVEFGCYLAEETEAWAGELLRVALGAIAVGNPHETEVPLLLPWAKISHERGHILDYHGYWTATRERGFLEDHWEYHAGRWTAWDEVFTAHGYYPLYMAGEAGVVASHSADGTDFGGGESWKALGDFPNYLAMIRRKNELIRAWNATHGNRMLGDALFTAKFWGWDHFLIGDGDVLLLIEAAEGW